MRCDVLFLKILKFYPKRFCSRIVGWVASCTLPTFLRVYLLGKFVKAYKINMEEAEHSLNKYTSFQELFSRKLRVDARCQDAPVPGFINSPVDGEVISHGRIVAGLAIQAKGLTYRIEELLKHEPNTERFEDGYYVTLYLSPKDYHHVHVPLVGAVKSVCRVEGELWPVNKSTTMQMFRLYERNRRVVWLADGVGLDDGLEVAVVLVGATHVGKIVIDPRWLSGKELPLDGSVSIDDQLCQAGENLGAFQFGSTVVLLIGGYRAARWRLDVSNGPILVGQRLGCFYSVDSESC